MKQLTVGVTGLAAGLNLQCYFFRLLPERYRMKWLCDLDPAKVEKGVAEYGGRGTGRFDDLLEDPEVDLVTIATPCATHAPLATRALEAGKHVLLEKPVTPTLEEADALVETAKSAKGVLVVDHERRFFANQKAVEAAVRDGALGRLLSVRLDLPNPSLVKAPPESRACDPSTWTARFVKTSAYDYLVHHADQLCRVLGEKPQRIYSRYRALEGDDLPAAWEILLQMPSGIPASLSFRSSFATDMKWSIEGEKATLRMVFENDMGPCHVYEPLPDGALKVRTLRPSCTSQEGFLDFYTRMHAAMTEGGPNPASVEDARDAIRILWRALESARAGEAVDF